MMRRSLLTSLFVLITTATLAAPPPVNPVDALAFMHQLWDRAAELLNGKTDPAIRRARFRQLFHEDFDVAVLLGLSSVPIGEASATRSSASS